MNHRFFENGGLMFLFVIIGFLPWGVPVYFLLTGDLYHWGIEYWNETVAWAMVLCLFHVAAVIMGIASLKRSPGLSALAITLGVLGIIAAVAGWKLLGLGQSSKQDAPSLEMIGFWINGGWVVAVIVIVPVTLLYSVGVVLKGRKQRIQRAA